MKKNIGVAWIRDGVLVDRMYINPVAFAFASWGHIKCETPNLLEDLINFGFEKSGVSCTEKMQLFNKEKKNIIQNIQVATDDYNKIATQAAENAKFFEGAVDLLKDLKNAGALNFITSAVNQAVLDEWEKYDIKGQMISKYLTEILGTRPGFEKGKDHFGYIVKKYKINKLYYVADAISEIKTGKQYSNMYNIIPIGFANVVTTANVIEGVEMVVDALKQLYKIDVKDLNLDQNKLRLPDENEIETALENADAYKIITKGKKGIMHSLREYFTEINLLPKNETLLKADKIAISKNNNGLKKC